MIIKCQKKESHHDKGGGLILIETLFFIVD